MSKVIHVENSRKSDERGGVSTLAYCGERINDGKVESVTYQQARRMILREKGEDKELCQNCRRFVS